VYFELASDVIVAASF